MAIGTTAESGSAARHHATTQPSLWRFVLHHKAVSLAVLALLLAFGALIAGEMVGRGSLRVSDSTSCSTWAAANEAQQASFARLYVREHGALTNGARSPTAIITAVNDGCTAAFGYDEADSVTVVQAIKGRY
jgi:hypothetical protein